MIEAALLRSRFSRQVLFAPIGQEGQERIGKTAVGIIGLGAVGAAIAEMLARAGVGAMHLVDRDVVEESNLARQTLYEARHARDVTPKAVAAVERLRALEGPTALSCSVLDVTPRSIPRLLRGIGGARTILCDATDSFESRYLLSDLAVREDLPLAYAGALGSSAASALILPGRTPCLRCLFPNPPDPGSAGTCDTVGVIAPAAQVAASFCVASILRYVVSADQTPLYQNVDVWSGRSSRIALTVDRRDPECPACGSGRFPSLDATSLPVVSLCGRGSYQVTPSVGGRVDLEKLGSRLGRIGQTRVTPHLVRVLAGGFRITVFEDGRALVGGVSSESAARKVYAEVVGS